MPFEEEEITPQLKCLIFILMTFHILDLPEFKILKTGKWSTRRSLKPGCNFCHLKIDTTDTWSRSDSFLLNQHQNRSSRYLHRSLYYPLLPEFLHHAEHTGSEEHLATQKVKLFSGKNAPKSKNNNLGVTKPILLLLKTNGAHDHKIIFILIIITIFFIVVDITIIIITLVWPSRYFSFSSPTVLMITRAIACCCFSSGTCATRFNR